MPFCHFRANMKVRVGNTLEYAESDCATSAELASPE